MQTTFSKELINKLTIFIKNQFKINHFSSLSITWTGGEPTLYINKIIEISDKIYNFCAKNNIVYYSGIVSNGILLNEDNYKKIKKYNLKRIQISIDPNFEKGISLYYDSIKNKNI